MYLPEYSITPKILKSIAAIEYDKAIIENTTTSPTWINQIKKNAQIATVNYLLTKIGIVKTPETVKLHIDGLARDTNDINIKRAIDLLKSADSLVESLCIDENTVTEAFMTAVSENTYRMTNSEKRPQTEEILARLVELFDWLNGPDASDTHPILKAGIAMAQTHYIHAFEKYNSWFENYIAIIILKASGYYMEGFLQFGNIYHSPEEFRYSDEDDLTEWLEYFTQKIAYETANVKEQVKLLAKEIKVTKVAGNLMLSTREERVIEYLQDYGLIQNKDFERIFPDISEDSVLRTLKALIEKGLVVKSGSTKSSRYILA